MLCTGCGEEASSSAKECFRTLRVERQDITLKRDFAAKIESEQNIYIRPQVSGRLMKIYVQEGAHVKKGQPLFVIDQAPYIAAVDAAKARVSTARAALAAAQLNLEGKEKLHGQKMVGESDLQRARHTAEEARAQVETAEAELATARTELGYTTISSPVDGVIGMVKHRVGDLVDPNGEPYLTLAADNSHIRAYGVLSEEALSELLRDFGSSSFDELLGKLPAVSLYTNWGEKLSVEGHIDAISPIVESQIGATYIRASFFNPAELFRNGSNGYLELPYVMHGVIVIPQEAVVDIHDKYLVFRVVDGKAVETEVTVMPYDDGQTFVVTGGLEPGDVIIAEGAGFVTDGMEVAEINNEKGGEPS